MGGLDIFVIILLVILVTIFVIFLSILIAAKITYDKIKNDLKLFLVQHTKWECTGETDKLPVFGPMTANQYSKGNSAACIRACENQSYSDGCGRDIILPGPDFVLLARYSGYDTVGNTMRPFCALFYSSSLKILFVCFSATIQVSEWEDTLLYHQVQPKLLNNSTDDMLVHQGFYNIYTGSVGGVSSLRDNILAGITKYRHVDDTILISGHSLGATLATLCFMDTCNLFPNTVLYSSGCPRVGNTPFAQFMQGQPLNYRLFNTEDIIPSLPPPFLFGWEYTQPGSVLQFSRSLDTYSDNHTESYIQFLEGAPDN